MYAQLKSLSRRLMGRMDALMGRLRVARSAESEELKTFWRNHGREWAAEEASHADLERIGALAEQIQPMSATQREAEVVAALKAVWRDGFFDPLDSFGWDDMDDGLPASSMVAFVEGVGEAWKNVRGNV